MKNDLKFRLFCSTSGFHPKKTWAHQENSQKDFVCALKANRLAAVSEEDYQNNRFTSIEDLSWQEEILFTGWLKDVPFPVLIVCQVFTNKDRSTGILYLACSGTTVTREFLLTIYQKRWPIEVFHKSLKQNAALGKAPVRRVVTQNNQVFAALFAFSKPACLKIKRHLNHFALRSRLYVKAIRVSFDELQLLKAA